MRGSNWMGVTKDGVEAHWRGPRRGDGESVRLRGVAGWHPNLKRQKQPPEIHDGLGASKLEVTVLRGEGGFEGHLPMPACSGCFTLDLHLIYTCYDSMRYILHCHCALRRINLMKNFKRWWDNVCRKQLALWREGFSRLNACTVTIPKGHAMIFSTSESPAFCMPGRSGGRVIRRDGNRLYIQHRNLMRTVNSQKPICLVVSPPPSGPKR
jgi:hypothetical protein